MKDHVMMGIMNQYLDTILEKIKKKKRKNDEDLTKKFEEFCSYLRKTYMSSRARYSPECWSFFHPNKQFLICDGTNNRAESLNFQLKKFIPKTGLLALPLACSILQRFHQSQIDHKMYFEKYKRVNPSRRYVILTQLLRFVTKIQNRFL